MLLLHPVCCFNSSRIFFSSVVTCVQYFLIFSVSLLFPLCSSIHLPNLVTIFWPLRWTLYKHNPVSALGLILGKFTSKLGKSAPLLGLKESWVGNDPSDPEAQSPWHLSQVLQGCSCGCCVHLPVIAKLQLLHRESKAWCTCSSSPVGAQLLRHRWVGLGALALHDTIAHGLQSLHTHPTQFQYSCCTRYVLEHAHWH